MQKYLLTVLIKEAVSEADRKTLLAQFTKDASNIKEDLWGLKSLSYPIKHNDKAFYAHLEFEAEPSGIPALDKKLKLEEDVIRYLLIKSKKVKKAKKSVKAKETKEVKEEAESPEVAAA